MPETRCARCGGVVAKLYACEICWKEGLGRCCFEHHPCLRDDPSQPLWQGPTVVHRAVYLMTDGEYSSLPPPALRERWDWE